MIHEDGNELQHYEIFSTVLPYFSAFEYCLLVIPQIVLAYMYM